MAISADKLRAAERLLADPADSEAHQPEHAAKEADSSAVEQPIAGFAGFSTAGGRSVQVSAEKMLAAQRLLATSPSPPDAPHVLDQGRQVSLDGRQAFLIK